MCVCVRTYAHAYVIYGWLLENNFQESVLFPHLGPVDWTQSVRLSSKPMLFPSEPPHNAPPFFFFKKNYSYTFSLELSLLYSTVSDILYFHFRLIKWIFPLLFLQWLTYLKMHCSMSLWFYCLEGSSWHRFSLHSIVIS